VKLAIYDFLFSDGTGLPVDSYEVEEIDQITEGIFRHIYWAYPEVPSPYYEQSSES